MELMEGLLTRRSVRKFADKPVAKQDIIDIIKAAQYAPSAHNTQPWSFLVIEDKEILKQFRHVQRSASFAENAPLVILVCGNAEQAFHREKKAGLILILTVPLLPKICFWPPMPKGLAPAGAAQPR